MTTAPPPRAPIYLAELNDGLEVEFPDSDVERTAPFGHITTYQELTTRLKVQLPDHDTIQGDPGTQQAAIGISIDPRVATLEDFRWVEVTRQNWLLVAQIDHQRCPLSAISGRRPTKKHPDQREHFDETLTDLVHDEKNDGRLPYVGLDANEPDPLGLATQTGLEWWAPFTESICGLLIPTRFTGLAITQLPKRQEHAPVIALVRVPLLAAQPSTEATTDV